MVRLRLRKVGSKAQQSFRLVAAEQEHPRDGRFLENLGHYNPRTQPATIVLDEPRVFHWLKNGAQPSESVLRLLKATGSLDRYNRFKAGEPAETLAAEAANSASLRNTTQKTTAEPAGAAKLSKKKKAAAAKAAA